MKLRRFFLRRSDFVKRQLYLTFEMSNLVSHIGLWPNYRQIKCKVALLYNVVGSLKTQDPGWLLLRSQHMRPMYKSCWPLWLKGTILPGVWPKQNCPRFQRPSSPRGMSCLIAIPPYPCMMTHEDPQLEICDRLDFSTNHRDGVFSNEPRQPHRLPSGHQC